MSITLKDVADLIKSGDAVQIKNQEDQGKTLDSIDKGIKKFFAIQERNRLDNLEDRREARKTMASVGGGISAAGAAVASNGSGGGGPSIASRILTQGIGSALGIGAYKLITAGFRGIRNTLASSFGTQRGALLDINKALTSELKDFQKVLKDDIKALKVQQKALNSELKGALSTEADLRRQIQAETKTFTEAGQARMKALQTRLDDAIARRQVLQTDLDSARADLSSARLDLKETRIALSEARVAGKLDAQALRNQVAALERRIATLRVGQIDIEQAFADRAGRLAAPNAQISGLKVGDNIQYKPATGGEVLDAKVMNIAGKNVQLKSGSNIFAVDAENLANRMLQPGYGEARIPMTINEALRSRGSLLNPFARGTRLNNALRLPGVFSPEGILEAGAATGSRVSSALGMSRTASTLGATSRLLSGGIGTFLSIITMPSSSLFGTQYTPMSKALREVFKNYTKNDINGFKLARQKLKQEVTKYSPNIKSLQQFVESYIFFELLSIEMNIFNGRGREDTTALNEEDKATVLMIKELLCAPIDVIALSMKENIGGENFEKFKKFNAAVNAAKQNPQVMELARNQADKRIAYMPGGMANPDTYQGIYTSALEEIAQQRARQQLGIKPGTRITGDKLSAIESAIAMSTYGPRVSNPPSSVVGHFGDKTTNHVSNQSLMLNNGGVFNPNDMVLE